MRFCFLAVASLAASGVMCAQTKNVTSVVRADPRTGRLVRSTVVAPKLIAAKTQAEKVVGPRTIEAVDPAKPSPAKVALPVNAIVEKTAAEYEVDPLLVHAVIQVESNYNPFAISSKGAQGLMQLIPSTARRFGVKDVFNVEENIRGGVKYLRYLQDTFKDDRLAIAAYNAGEGAVQRYNWIPPYPETMNYVYQVGKRYGMARKTAGKQLASSAKPASAAETTAATAPKEPEHPPVEVFIDDQGRLHMRTR